MTQVAHEEDFAAAQPPGTKQVPASFPIVELRQYSLHQGQRDTLIQLFERHFIEPQETLGMKVIGTFRDLDRPNRFVWLRGFSDMDSRLTGLSKFYSGRTWEAHRQAANRTMIDSDNVLLLRAPDAAAAFGRAPVRPRISDRRASSLVLGTICHLSKSAKKAAEIFRRQVVPRLAQVGAEPLAWFIPEAAPNNYPRLPVREGEQVLVWFLRLPSAEDHSARKSAIDAATEPLEGVLESPPELLRLAPTSRSELR